MIGEPLGTLLARAQKELKAMTALVRKANRTLQAINPFSGHTDWGWYGSRVSMGLSTSSAILDWIAVIQPETAPATAGLGVALGFGAAAIDCGTAAGKHNGDDVGNCFLSGGSLLFDGAGGFARLGRLGKDASESIEFATRAFGGNVDTASSVIGMSEFLSSDAEPQYQP